MTDAAVSVTVEGTRTAVAIQGEIDLANHALVEEQINAGISNQTVSVMVDLTGVSFIDSTGLRILFGLATTLERLQVDLEICAPTASPARRVIDLSGLSSVVRVLPEA